MITFVTLSGFLGSGKTTTMLAAAREFERRGHEPVVITNDQGSDLVDSSLARERVGGVGEVTGGCFCCKFEDLVDTTVELVTRRNADVVIAEAVGSCTDIRATVVRPLQEYYGDRFRVAPLTTVVDPLRYRAFRKSKERGEPDSELSYLFRTQLTEAEIIAINKVDVHPETEIAAIVDELAQTRPDADVVACSALTGRAVPELVDRWSRRDARRDGEDLDVDYDRYADAEAMLGWLNQSFDVRAGSDSGTFAPARWIEVVLGDVARACARAGHVVGHAKVVLEGAGGISKASLVAADASVTYDDDASGPVSEARATVNARVACEPAELEAIVAGAVERANEQLSTTTTPLRGTAFKPGYPRPTHRLVSQP